MNKSELQPMTDIGPLLVNTKTAAMLLCVSERTLWTMTNCGDIPCVRIGRAKRGSRPSSSIATDTGFTAA